ncbi:MAG TPA: hypothetical protein VGQ47_04360 [Candidatus Limnocylindrales bacterium]|jgi:hypothetical protein|nr:hypothetical protein [Candidatus Limnocylindrales bacterium]
MSFIRRLLGGGQEDRMARPDEGSAARETTREEAALGEEELPIEADEQLPEDLKAYLYPQDEFVLRQQRYARYRWEPPANEPVRDPRLAPLGALLTRSRQPTDEQVARVVRAFKRRPREFDATLDALRETARASGRESDLAAAHGFRLGDPLEPESEPQVPDELRAAISAAGEALAVRDLLSADQIEVLTGPWRAGYGDVPER